MYLGSRWRSTSPGRFIPGEVQEASWPAELIWTDALSQVMQPVVQSLPTDGATRRYSVPVCCRLAVQCVATCEHGV